MDDLFSVLWAVNRTPVTNQRSLAGQLEMSVGKVNSLLKEAEEQGLLNTVKEGKGSRFLLTNGRILNSLPPCSPWGKGPSSAGWCRFWKAAAWTGFS